MPDIDQQTGQPSRRLPIWRVIVAVVFGLLAVFSGGCSLLFIPDVLRGNQYIDWSVVAVVGGVPFVISAVIVWLSLRAGKG
jgi:hypothetical protein